MIRPATPEDADAITRIYNHYIEHTIITFEETPITPDDMRTRMAETMKQFPWYCCESDGQIVGYAYATKWKGRCAYRHSAESTVYLDKDASGNGYGSELYTELLNELRSQKFHTIMGGIALPNPASVALHEKFGFKKVAHFSEVGRKFDKWIDVGYWQLIYK